MTRAELAAALDRYRGLVDDWPAFIDALRAPHVPSVRINELRQSPEWMAAAMVAAGLRPEPISWLPGGYRLRPRADAAEADSKVLPVGQNWLYQTGLYQVQEESSMLPVHLLDPQPGERILDLCAAPGNKTAQIALALGGRGTVIANDRNRHRLAALHNTVSRLGLCNVTMTATDGCQFPMQPTLFDRALVDAPCTSEGTARKHRRAGQRQAGFGRYINGIQRALLRRALALTRPGGRVVYSTCTFAPEENEMVIDAVLTAHPDAARVVPITPLPGLPISPGISSWNGRKLADELVGCARMWPHRTGTGGFFVAVLERCDGVVSKRARRRARVDGSSRSGDRSSSRSGGRSSNIAPDSARVPAQAPARARTDGASLGWRPALEHPAIVASCERYGLDTSPFEHLLVGQRGRYLRMTASNHQFPVGLTIVATGLAAMPAKAAQARFTTAGVLAFGAQAQRCVVDLTAEQSARYLRRHDIALQHGATVTSDRGFTIVRRCGEIALGNAQILAQNGASMLASRFPRAWLRGPRSP